MHVHGMDAQVSDVGCSCILALYLVSLPARNRSGARVLSAEPRTVPADPSAFCARCTADITALRVLQVLGPESYCDAVGWSGVPCPEMVPTAEPRTQSAPSCACAVRVRTGHH